MSETAPEPAPAPTRSSSSNVFTRKMGPLPVWAWMGVALGVALAYYYWKQNKASASTASQASSTQAGTTDSSLVPQFVNQTYVNDAPPQQPNPVPPPTDVDPGGPSKPPPGNAQANQYPAPTGLKVSKLTGTSAKVNWNYITGATPKPSSYTVALYQLNGKLASYTTVNAPDTASGAAQYTVTGLHPGWQYNVRVWANGGKVAPPHAETKLTLLWLGLVSR
jgi:hypothetical protein